MSLPVIAIIISSASAAFTLSNWLTSVATYRRGGPRLKVKAKIGPPPNVYDLYHSGKPDDWRAAWHVHVANRSSARVEVEKVEALPWAPHLPFTPFGRVLTRLIVENPALGPMTKVTWLDGEDRKKIEPFDGVRWILSEEISRVRMDTFVGRFSIMSLRVTLNNGQEVFSTTFRTNYVASKHDEVHSHISRLAEEERKTELERTGQLTFEDIFSEAGE
ncbi:hypothetical protein OG824_05160 [Streptomyces prunicolor]|uniref:hypothetical protein n=1 Tax=Streptomyces prunicolor TaxID=67348 RepID=UPI00224F9159|nr:hypothetical protein [Streptomyces prunicolor]MCX5234620.1 hypothetical protein [Streptomyces prunicolor]